MADNIEEEVLEFVTDTVAEYTNHGRSGDESRLFSIMVRLATCLLAINLLLSGVASLSNEQEFLFVSLFSTLSGLYMVVDDGLGVVCQGGDNLVQIRRGRPRISIDISHVEGLLELDVHIVDIARNLGMYHTTLWRRLSELNVRMHQ